MIRLEIPLLLEAIPEYDDTETLRDIATKYGTMLIEDLAAHFENEVSYFSMGCPMDTTINLAIESLQKQVIDAVQGRRALYHPG